MNMWRLIPQHRARFLAASLPLTCLLAHAAHAQPTPEELQAEIRKRDAVIDSLLKRVDALEKQAHAGEPTMTAAPAQSKRQVAGTQAPPPSPASPTLFGGTPMAAAAVPTMNPPETTTPGEDNEIEEATIARALENTLIDQGALLLAPWTMQVVPDFSYTYQAINQLSFVSPSVVPGAVGNSLLLQNSRRSLLEWGLGFRLGLPWETQLDIRVPVGLDFGSATFGNGYTANSTRGGIGDVSVGLEKQIFHEQGLLPDVLLNLTYKSNTGNSNVAAPQVSTFPFAVGTGSGFNTLTGGVTLLKRQDPLVFLGGLSYTHSFPSTIAGVSENNGDSFNARFGVVLAASPDTSLRVEWLTSFQQQSTVSHRSIPGTNEEVSALQFGVGSVITPRLFMDAAVNIGMTPDTPGFEALISFPYRF